MFFVVDQDTQFFVFRPKVCGILPVFPYIGDLGGGGIFRAGGPVPATHLLEVVVLPPHLPTLQEKFLLCIFASPHHCDKSIKNFLPNFLLRLPGTIPRDNSSELLILFWGLFFIATRDDTPQLKARPFVEPVKEIIRRRSLSVDSGASASQAEELPAWESAYGGNGNRTTSAGITRARGTAAAAGFPVVPPVNGGTGSGHNRQRIVSEGKQFRGLLCRQPIDARMSRRRFRAACTVCIHVPSPSKSSHTPFTDKSSVSP